MSLQRPPSQVSATVCVVGLGYVGLPLAVAFDEAGLPVIGYDVDSKKVNNLAEGTDPTGEIGDDTVAEGDVSYTVDTTRIGAADYVIITVPTPLDEHDNPDLEFIGYAAETIGTHLTPDTTVVLESTVYPGATEEVLVPAIETESGYTVGDEFEVGYSSERMSPGDGGRTIEEATKVVGGRTPAVGEDLADLYRQVVDAGIHVAPDIRTAEASKLVENTQRDVNIALMNEVARICEELDLGTEDVLDAAGTKWNFHDEYSPGLVGGHCIPVDPHYLEYSATREGVTPQVLSAAREVNDRMPEHVADLTLRALNEAGNTLKESRVLVLGLTYKPDVDDFRASAHQAMISDLREYGTTVVGHDPYADGDEMRNIFDIDYREDLSFEGFDGVVIGTAHEAYDSLDIQDFHSLDGTPVLVDVPGVFSAPETEKQDIVYRHV